MTTANDTGSVRAVMTFALGIVLAWSIEVLLSGCAGSGVLA